MLRLLSTLLALVITTSAGAGTRAADQSGGRFVFGTDVDPIVLDPALSSEPSSARVENQIFESLVDLVPGGSRVVPRLAMSWRTSNERRTWTFLLRRGVRFHDGTLLNARAVCFNFERWSHFEGSLQRAAYYWAFIFGSKPSDSLYRGCEAVGELTVRLHLARATTSFLAALAFPSFGISSPIALRKYDADAGEADANGAFDPAGTYGTAHPTGTGPFVFKSWRRGADVVLVRNRRYWGKQAKLDRLVFRPIVDGLERVRALQRGTIHGLDVDLAYVGATSTIKRDPKLKLLPRPSSNVGFVAMNQQIAPLDKPLVRQAIAYGLDRRTVVRSFYSGRGQVADQLLPPIFVGHARKVRRYPFDPARSRALLRKAGMKLPVKLDFWFPTDVSRPYMPDPKRNFEIFAASLERSGFKVVPHSAPWTPDYTRAFITGKAQLCLSGWIADFMDPDNFFGLFRRYEPQFGFRDPKLFRLLARADAEPNLPRRARLYQQASRMVMELLPMVPYVHYRRAVALRRNVTGFAPDPAGPYNESFAAVAFAPR